MTAVNDQVSSAWFVGSWPVTQLFGVWESVAGLNGPHTGLDIGLPTGTQLQTPVHATVQAAGPSGSGYGNWVKLLLDDGSTVILGHLQSVSVSPGQDVTPGTKLGVSDSTGASTGPHLHFEVRNPGGTPVDPSSVIGLPMGAGAPTSAPAQGGSSNPLDALSGMSSFFGHLVQQDHDPCKPSSDEGTVFRILDAARCRQNWWKLLFIGLGGMMVVWGLEIYFFHDEVRAGEAAAEAAA